MKRILLIVAGAVAALAFSAAPALAGLAGNPSFSHRIPVRVPSGASVALTPAEHHDRTPAATTPTTVATASHVEPGDDRGHDATDNDRPSPSATASHVEPGDDRGHDATDNDRPSPSVTASHVEPGDDHGHDGTGHDGTGHDGTGHH